MKTFYLIGIFALIVSCSSSEEITNGVFDDASSFQLSPNTKKNKISSTSDFRYFDTSTHIIGKGAVINLTVKAEFIEQHFKLVAELGGPDPTDFLQF